MDRRRAVAGLPPPSGRLLVGIVLGGLIGMHGCYRAHERSAPAPPTDASAPADARGPPRVDLVPPRPLFPPSTSTATSRRPTFRWSPADGTDGARVEVCADRACAETIAAADVGGSTWRPEADLPPGLVYWRLTSRSSGSLGRDAGPSWPLSLGVSSAPVDPAWGTTLDVDHDRRADLAVSAFGAAMRDGRVYVLASDDGGLEATPHRVLDNPAGAMATFGFAIAGAGDVNGDGFADLVVGATQAGEEGRAYLYLGAAAGLTSEPAAILVGPEDADNRNFGWSVAGAGDVNGDGYGDVLVGATGGPSGTPPGGRAHLFFGAADGLEAAPASSLVAPDGRGSGFGWSVAGVGDLNGDRLADVAVGAPLVQSSVGRCYVYLGTEAGLALTPTRSLRPDEQARGIGESVAGAGDVNGDGYADLLIAADGATYLDRARVFLHLGGPAGVGVDPATTIAPEPDDRGFGALAASAGDVNADGYADVVLGGATGTLEGFARVYRGSSEGLRSGTPWALRIPDGEEALPRAVIGAGDVDGDGYADLAVGGFGDPTFTGRLFLFRGGPEGPGAAPAAAVVGPDGPFGFFGRSLAGAR
ncbi:MAG: FG-GAP-like repeat-containing protein [Sandaracinaceae bacterium]